MPEDLERLVPLRDSGHRTPLFCIHAVSGSAYAYAGLVKLLPDEQPVFGFEAPGFDNDRAPVNRMPVLAEEYAKILREFQPAGDFQLLGWSLGGALAFDMALRLAAAGTPVARLVLVDSGLPYVAEFPPEKAVVARFMADLAGMSGIPQETIDPVFAGVADDTPAADLFDRIEQAEILPEELDAELLLSRFVTFAAHLEALYNYAPPAKHEGRTLHVMAAESPPETMRWDTVVTDLDEAVLPGNHYSIWTGDSLVELARIVDGFLLP
jgi:thioesterase domain-containing protein